MDKKNSFRKLENGQIIYLVAIGIVLLFGFLGLAVDGGRLYSENRKAQHAADNAALTGALYIGQNYQTLEDQQAGGDPSACELGVFCLSNRSSRNALESAGFHITDLLVDYYVEAQPSPYSGIKYVDIEVILEVEIEPYFARVFTDQALRTEVTAVARVYPSQNFAFGYSMLSTDRDICNGIILQGSVDILLAAGGLHSNTTSDSCDAILISGGGNTEVTIVGPFTGSSTLGTQGNPSIDPSTDYIQIPAMSMQEIPTPECDTPVPNWMEDIPEEGTNTYYPGNQSNMQFQTPGSIIFEPGIYCVSGDFGLLGGDFYGDGVMFYIIDGDVFIAGSAILHISAPTGGVTDINGTVYDGMLIYMAPDNEGDIQILGNAESELTGTIYAPGPPPSPQAKCDLTGASHMDPGTEVNFGIQMICSTIKVHGNAALNLAFNEDDLYSPPPELSLLH